MTTYYVKKQCTHCKTYETFATIKDEYVVAAQLAEQMSKDEDYKGFVFVVESPPQFKSKDLTQNEASI